MKLIYFLIFIFPIYIQAQDTELSRTVVVREGNILTKATVSNEPFNHKPAGDVVYFFYFRGSIHSAQGSYTGALLHGRYETYYENDALKVQGDYKFGLKHGKWKYWYHNGNLQLVEIWKNGKKNGTFEEYDQDGRLSKKGKYRAGVLNGNVSFYAEGVFQETLKFKNGTPVEQRNNLKKQSKQSIIKRDSTTIIILPSVTFEQAMAGLPVIQEGSAPLDTSRDHTVQNMAAINSGEFECAAASNAKGDVFYVKQGKSTGKGYKIFKTERKQDGTTGMPFQISPDIKGATHFGPFVFINEENKILLTRTITEDGKSTKRLGIYEASYTDKSILNFSALSINLPESDNCHPALSPDQQILVFASNRSGGLGGMDLYISTKINGQWCQPINLGPTINSPGNEMFPSFDARGFLFFSSDRRNGNGGLDIYFSFNSGAKWAPVSALPFPFNSPGDDFSIMMDDASKTGYFSSNRKGGAGKDDVYTFSEIESINRSGNASTVVAQPAKTFKRMVDHTLWIVDAKTGQDIPAAALFFLPAKLLSAEEAAAYKPGSPLPSIFELKGVIQNTDGSGKKIIPAYKEDMLIAVQKNGYESLIFRIPADDQRGVIKTDLKQESHCKTVQGTVTDRLHQRAIPNAIIQLSDKKTGVVMQEFQTDNNGRFTCCTPCNSTYKIKITSEGMEPVETELIFNGNCEDKKTEVKAFFMKPYIKPVVTPVSISQNANTPETPEQPPVIEGKYHLIGGVFSQRANAEKLVNDLKNLGYTNTVIRKYPGIANDHVCIAVFNDQAAAKAMADILLKKNKIKTYIKKM